MVLLALYIHYRDDTMTTDKGEGELPIWTMQIIVGVVAGVVLSISFAYIAFNEHELFSNDDLPINGYWLLVYLFGLGLWLSVLAAPNAVFLFLPVVYQIKTLAALDGGGSGHGHGSLSLLSLGLQTGMFLSLGALQAARDWSDV
ncbi:hypothetical protein Sste5344_007775 [Sporothrix stenoceras]